MLFCGIDIGTTNTKGILVDTQGRIRSTVKLPATAGIPTATSAGGWVDPFLHVCEHLKTTDSKSAIVCSVATQGGSFIGLDGAYQPVGKPFSWLELADNDTKTRLIDDIGIDAFYHRSGWVPDRWLACCKIRQHVQTTPIARRPAYVAFVPESIYAHICNRFKTDITNAQITGLCDFQGRRWDETLCRWAGIEPQQLADIACTPEIVAEQVDLFGQTWNFATSIHDQYAAMAAVNLKPDRQIMLATGTAWVINARTSTPRFDAAHHRMHPGKDLLTDGFGNIIALGPIGNRFDALVKEMGFRLDDIASIEKPFNVNNAPVEPLMCNVWDASAPFQTTEAPWMRIQRYMQFSASLAAFHIERLSLHCPVETIIMTGGATANHHWPQLIADVCGLPVEVWAFDELTAFGAAVTAYKACFGCHETLPTPGCVSKKSYLPQRSEYRHWYLHCQRSILEREYHDHE